MDSSKTIISTALLLACALLVVEASRYNSLSAYPSNGYRHSSNNNYRHNGNRGAHSMSSHAGHQAACRGYNCRGNGYDMRQQSHARPVVYGGRGIYQYSGYTRHHRHPANGYGAMRSHGSSGCNGYNCGAQQNGYAMRPVKALALAPSYGSHNTGYKSQGHHGGYHHQPRQHSAGSYRADSSSHYAASRHHQPAREHSHHGHGNRNTGGY